MTWHPMTTEQVATTELRAQRTAAERHRRHTTPRRRSRLAHTLRTIADRIDSPALD